MNSTVQKLNSLVPVGNFLQNTSRNASVPMSASLPGSWKTSLYWIVGLVILLLLLFAYFYEPMMESIQNWMDVLNMWITGKGSPTEVSSQSKPVLDTTTPDEDATKQSSGMESVVEKILPPAKDVFTVSKNDYTYYDAAPLCKALGAELATYDQVKTAWQKGADWCNYGWVKGQMAVFPTQNSTYEELQQGHPDQHGVCGKPGVNGGYFDNPELKFGVTCIGKKPSQKEHDVTSMTSGATRPLTASGIVFEEKVQKFKNSSNTIGILPFNDSQWSS